MNVLVISGSQRPQSQSKKVAERVVEKLSHHEVSHIDLVDIPIDLNITEAWKEGTASHKNAETLRAATEKADAVVMVTPEWNGMASASIRNAIHHVGKTLAHKPIQIIAVSAGAGGANPIQDLKGFSAKNSHAIYVPEHIIVRHVNDVLNSSDPVKENRSDVFLHEKLDYSLSLLEHYASALKQFRADAPIDFESHENGM